ncbi:MAG: aldolase/citrate lyase family protein [Clostridiales bacterium]|nr:aldolase/citrate lyase family protein [Clostridiales bacterium]
MKNILQMSKDGKRSMGIYITIPSPEIVEMAGIVGFDFIRIDCEHGMIGMADVRNLIRAASAFDMAVQVRVASCENITRMLDFGVSGIVVPNIRTKEDAQAAVDRVKYAPLGARDMATFGRCLDYGQSDFGDYWKTANQQVCLIIQLETREALSNIDEIFSVPGIDMVSSGKMDLSQSLNVPGKIGHPDVLAAESLIIKKACEHGIQPTFLANSVERARKLFADGVFSITVGMDCKLLINFMKNYILGFTEV